MWVEIRSKKVAYLHSAVTVALKKSVLGFMSGEAMFVKTLQRSGGACVELEEKGLILAHKVMEERS